MSCAKLPSSKQEGLTPDVREGRCRRYLPTRLEADALPLVAAVAATLDRERAATARRRALRAAGRSTRRASAARRCTARRSAARRSATRRGAARRVIAIAVAVVRSGAAAAFGAAGVGALLLVVAATCEDERRA